MNHCTIIHGLRVPCVSKNTGRLRLRAADNDALDDCWMFQALSDGAGETIEGLVALMGGSGDMEVVDDVGILGDVVLSTLLAVPNDTELVAPTPPDVFANVP